MNEEKNSSNEKGIDSIYETIELNGKETKIMTKLNCKEISKSNKKEDYHKLMKNPFSSNLFGYKFIRKKKIDISRQSLNNRNLIGKIHHLIINPNTKEFRNEYLLQPQKIFVTPKNLKSNKDYKSLSKGGIERLRKIRNIKYRSEIKINSEKVGELKKKIDKLMEKNKKKFIEQKKEVENEED